MMAPPALKCAQNSWPGVGAGAGWGCDSLESSVLRLYPYTSFCTPYRFHKVIWFLQTVTSSQILTTCNGRKIVNMKRK